MKYKCNCDDLVQDFMERYRRKWIEKQSDTEDAAQPENNCANVAADADLLFNQHPSDPVGREEKTA